MLDIRRVLFPTDHSETAEQAFAHAAHLAAFHGAELHALHVTSDDSEKMGEMLPHAPADSSELLGSTSASTVGSLKPEEVILAKIEADSPAEGILEYAAEHKVDLIVMGTHGRGVMERVLIGSVAERVVRKADCPVLTVRSPGGLAMRRILVPVDFSDRSKAVIPVALELAGLYVASVEFFNVISEDDLPVSGAPVLGPSHVAPEEVERRIRKLMSDLVKEHQGEVVVTGTVRVGKPSDDILEYAEENADMIVMATHGRSGLQRLLLGSVAEKVVRRAPCPVFTVKSFGSQAISGG